MKTIFTGLLSLVAGVLLWHVLLAWLYPGSLLPLPWRVFVTFIDLLSTRDFYLHIGASVKILGIGWLVGALSGWLIGLLIGLSVVMRRVLSPWLVLLFPIPKIALLPVFILVFGISDTARIATIMAGVFFPVVFCVYQGVRSVPLSLIEMGKTFGLTRLQQVRMIVIPGVLPSTFLACRLTTAIGLILLVSAEMIGARYGIGAFILGAGSMAQMEQLFAGVLILSLFGLSLFMVWELLEKRLIHWKGQGNQPGGTNDAASLV